MELLGVGDLLSEAFSLVFQWKVLLVIAVAAAYGTLVGAIPGLTATMAVALIVPLTFYLNDVQAIAVIVTAVTCSIFAGDIPSVRGIFNEFPQFLVSTGPSMKADILGDLNMTEHLTLGGS